MDVLEQVQAAAECTSIQMLVPQVSIDSWGMERRTTGVGCQLSLDVSHVLVPTVTH